MPQMPVIYKRPQAKTDLIDVWLYIANDSSQNADQYLRKIEQAMQTLSEQPLMGKSRSEIHDGIRSFPIDSHVILYFPLEDGIDIVRVLGGGQDIESYF